MPVVNNPPSPQNQHVRNTITFTGGAGAGAVGTVTVFTITGRVIMRQLVAVCTTSLVSAGGGSIALGTAGATTGFSSGVTATNFTTTNNLWDGGGTSFVAGIAVGMGVNKLVSQNIIITVSVGDVTGGVIVFDAFYDAVTDTGALA